MTHPTTSNHAVSSDTTLERILEILKKEYKTDISGFSADTTLADTGLDSLSIADLLFEVEDVFEIKLDDLSPDQIPKQLSGLVSLIDAQIAKTIASK
jgi:acyl carrier protein